MKFGLYRIEAVAWHNPRPLRSRDTINLSFKFVKTCPTLILSEVNSTDTFQNKD